jgi:hypothetical protein
MQILQNHHNSTGVGKPAEEREYSLEKPSRLFPGSTIAEPAASPP